MPILLDTPFSPGDLDPGQQYTHAGIVRFGALIDLPNQPGSLEIVVEFGTVDQNGKFVRGVATRVDKIIVSDNAKTGTTDYTTLKNASPIPGLSTYNSVGAQLYMYLISKGLYPGTIV